MKSDKNSERIALELTDTARDNIFVDSTVHGRVKVAGKGNKFFRTKVFLWKKEHPVWFLLGVVASIFGIITGLISFYQFFFPQKSQSQYAPQTIGDHSSGNLQVQGNVTIDQAPAPKFDVEVQRLDEPDGELFMTQVLIKILSDFPVAGLEMGVRDVPSIERIEVLPGGFGTLGRMYLNKVEGHAYVETPNASGEYQIRVYTREKEHISGNNIDITGP
ncbi:hypothetical protein M0Q28_01230 [Patescibacteria group bacterium]|jgi:hypothetical protein|nr:hypothetical protein [Patescibacteria group bacterium]